MIKTKNMDGSTSLLLRILSLFGITALDTCCRIDGLYSCSYQNKEVHHGQLQINITRDKIKKTSSILY